MGSAATPEITGTPDLAREPFRAFGSYSWATREDQESIGRLVSELRLRGFATFRDRDSLPPAAGIESRIRADLERSTVVVPYLTPQALESDPVVELEFRTAAELERTRGRPILMPVVRNLGEDRAELTASTWDRLGYDFSARWTQIPPPGPDALEWTDAAKHARDALQVALPAGGGPDDGRWEILLASRGDRPAPAQLTVDATDLLGGLGSQAGDSQTWSRLFDALCDLKGVLSTHGHRRRVLIRPFCHLSAAVAAGWAFRTMTGWSVTAVAIDGAECSPSRAQAHPELLVSPPEYGSFRAHGGTLVVSIDLVPRDIAAAVRRDQAEPPRGHLVITRASTGVLVPSGELAAMAAASAAAIKRQCATLAPDRIALYLAVPAVFAVLLGAELGALGCPLVLHEYTGSDYLPSIEIPR